MPEQDQDIETPIVEEETEEFKDKQGCRQDWKRIFTTIQKSPGNLFSDGLEELINSVAESDELTDKKKEIVLRRAVKKHDEVEMVLEARFFRSIINTYN